MGMTMCVRQGFNPFADEATPILWMITFIIGKGLEGFLLYLSSVKIKRFGWRGLWMTKQVEGTVDDDVAAKLAIGEGRQQDLEQERLELQALNSERFRHRFLERNRPWILQHLVELLTPRQLDEEGPDGRPVIEYVRDVYSDLMQIGEGMRKPGDREDISSDDEDDLENARRNWSRQPLTGASLAIARMWLAKARKRRAFGKLIRGIVEQNKAPMCGTCGRSEAKHKVKLTAHISTKGKPDISALDNLIRAFEEQYGIDELEPQLWKAFFRSQAEFATRCNICEDAVAQDRMLLAGRAPGPQRPTRPEDISSDESDDEVQFEPIIVTRTSPEGRMMSKWLLGARQKLGGIFPRPDAKRQMDRYAKKLRDLKMKKAKSDAAKKEDDKAADELVEGFDEVTFNAATIALAQRWIRKARESLEDRFKQKSGSIRETLETTLGDMPEEDDWYFGSGLRMEGQHLLQRGVALDDDRRTLEAEAAVKINRIQIDLENYMKARDEELHRERNAFELKLAQQVDRTELDMEIRHAELQRLRESKAVEFAQIEKQAKMELGAAPTEMTQSHRNQLNAIDQQMVDEKETALAKMNFDQSEARVMFDRAEKIKINDLTNRKIFAGTNTARIRDEVAGKVKTAEAEWQGLSSKWLAVATKKVQVKKKEDSDARATRRKRAGDK